MAKFIQLKRRMGEPLFVAADSIAAVEIRKDAIAHTSWTCVHVSGLADHLAVVETPQEIFALIDKA